MPIYEMRAPNGRTYRVSGPAGATEDQVRDEILRQHPDAGSAPQAKAAAPKVPSRAEAFSVGLDQSKLNAFNAMMTGARKIGLVGPETPEQRQQRANFQRDYGAPMAEVRRARPRVVPAGEIFGEAVLTEPLTLGAGGALAKFGNWLVKETGRIAKVSPKVAKVTKRVGRVAQATGKTVQQGGIGVKAVSKEAVREGAPVVAGRVARVAARATGGATAGAISAAATDKDVVDAMVAGSVIPVAGNIAKNGIGWAYDLLTRRLGEVKAAQIMRNLIADKSSGIIEALQNAPKNIQANTAEFLASKGLLTPELAAAIRIVSGGSASKPLQTVATGRAAAQNEMRNLLRGGESATEGMANVAAAKQAVRQETEPMRQAFMERADIGRTQILPAEQRAADLRAAAADEAAKARRLMLAGERRGGLAETQAAVVPGEATFLGPQGQMPRLTADATSTEAVQRLRGEAGALFERGVKAGEKSVKIGEDARSADEVAANLRAQGLAPLDISSVTGRLRQLANDALPGSDRQRIFTKFADMLDKRAQQFDGTIDATGLHLARREMGEFVSSILRGRGADPTAIQRGTAQLMGEAQPLIDDAFKAAGGPEWGDYLDAFSQGMRKVERQDFGRKLAELPEARYAKVMAGGDPEFVYEHFGPGRFDINVEMFGPELPTAHRLATDINAQRAVAQTGLEDLSASQRLALPSGAQARVGEAFEPGVANVFARGLSRIIGGFPGLYGGGQFATEAERKIAEKLYTNAMRRLAPALAQPSVANRLLGVQPATATIDAIMGQINPNILAQLIRGTATTPSYRVAPAETNYSE